MTWVKICGVRSPEEALHAQACGADAVGINLFPPSPRSVDLDMALRIREVLRIEAVLVLVDADLAHIHALITRLAPDRIQLHGRLPAGPLPPLCFRTFRAVYGVLQTLRSEATDPFLLDAAVPGLHGGTGKQVDLALAREASRIGRLILAGGLRPGNVAQALREVRPWGVDTASGVEAAPGRQDPERVRAFVDVAREQDAAQPAGPQPL